MALGYIIKDGQYVRHADGTLAIGEGGNPCCCNPAGCYKYRITFTGLPDCASMHDGVEFVLCLDPLTDDFELGQDYRGGVGTFRVGLHLGPGLGKTLRAFFEHPEDPARLYNDAFYATGDNVTIDPDTRAITATQDEQSDGYVPCALATY